MKYMSNFLQLLSVLFSCMEGWRKLCTTCIEMYNLLTDLSENARLNRHHEKLMVWRGVGFFFSFLLVKVSLVSLRNTTRPRVLGFQLEQISNKLNISECVQNIIRNNILKVPRNPTWALINSRWRPKCMKFYMFSHNNFSMDGWIGTKSCMLICSGFGLFWANTRGLYLKHGQRGKVGKEVLVDKKERQGGSLYVRYLFSWLIRHCVSQLDFFQYIVMYSPINCGNKKSTLKIVKKKKTT